MPGQFARGIKKLTPEGIGMHRHRNYRRTDIFLEGFEQVIAEQHQIVPCGIGIEILERQLFKAIVFKRLVCQFIITPPVIPEDRML